MCVGTVRAPSKGFANVMRFCRAASLSLLFVAACSSPSQPPDLEPCAADPCAATGKTCVAADGVAVCSCPAGFVDQGNGCVQVSPCATLACAEANKTACFVDNGIARCVCNPGFTDNGAGCAPITMMQNDGGVTVSCTAQHSGQSGDDSFEPDECPMLSALYSSAQSHTLSGGDADWVHLSAPGGHILKFEVTGSSIPISLDLFSGDGSTAVAAEHTGANNPQLQYVATQSTLLYVRIAAAAAADTGSYTFTVTDVGTDDYPNEVSAATAVVGSTFAGLIHFADDVDVARLSVQAGHAYRFALGANTDAGIAIEVLDLDAATLRKTLDSTIVANTTHLARPRMAGSYTLKAKSTNGEVGDFSVSLNDLGVDDRGDVLLDADAVQVSASPTTGNFERSDDADVFTFAVVPNHTYRFTCVQSTRGCVMSMRDAAGAVVAQQPSQNSSTTTIAALPIMAGTWSVTVQPYTTGSSALGTYSYQLEDLGGDDYSNSYQTPFVLTLGSSTQGSLELTTDIDSFGFATTMGRIYRVVCNAPSSQVCALTVRDATGATVATASNANPVQVRSSAGGQYTVDVGASVTGQYTITVTDIGLDDYGDTLASAVPLTLGTPSMGVVNYSSDVDYFSFATTAGHAYQLTCGPSGSYCRMKVYDQNGTQVADSISQGVVGVLAATATTYRVGVQGLFSSTYGDYSITVVDVGTDDHPNTSTGAMSLTLGVNANGSVQYASDRDVFTFAGTAGHLYKAVSTSVQTVVVALTITDAGGTAVATGTSYSTTTSVVFKVPSTQTYQVQVMGASQQSYGQYQLVVTDEGLDDFGDSPALATPITLGMGMAGRIDYPNDLDVVSFAAQANHIYRVNCSSNSSYFCDLTVRNTAAATVASANNNTTTTAQFFAAAAGTYTVELAASFSSYGAYSFQVLDEGVDDNPNTAAGATVITPGTFNGSFEYAGDRDVFRVAATAGSFYSVNMVTNSSSSVTIRDPSGVLVRQSTGSAGFNASVSGTYSFEIGAGSTLGLYSFALTSGTDDAPDVPAGAPTLTLAVSTNATMNFVGDTDYFAITLAAGTSYTITTTGTPVYVVAYQPDGTTPIGSQGYLTRTFSTTQAGTHYVRVIQASGTGAYTVRVQ